jgi:hypothetical protein
MEIGEISLDQLMDLNRKVCAEIRYRHEVKNHEVILKVNIGDTVQFDSGRRGMIKMVVESVKGKHLHGRTSNGMMWKAAAGICTIVKGV